jgi:hypothetical protein
MIQRIQTIFLFISFALCGLLVVVNPIYAEFDYVIDGAEYQAIFLFWSSFGESITGRAGVLSFENYWWNFILLILSGSLSFVSIFMFRFTRIQIFSVLISSLFIGILGLKLMYQYINFKNNNIDGLTDELNAHIFWIVLILALNILAVFAIQLDRRSIPQNYFVFPKG